MTLRMRTLSRKKDFDTITAEPIYDVPRIKYNDKTKKKQERTGIVEVNTYHDDLAVWWVMPTVENKEMITMPEENQTANGLIEKAREVEIPELQTMKRNQKRSDGFSQETLHGRLMKELHERFLIMEIMHELK